MAPGPEPVGGERVAHRSTATSLVVFAIGYNLAHHNGLIGSTGAGGGTRLADWVDMLTPFVVVGPVLWFLWSRRVGPRNWLIAAVGSIVYVEGHGVHLAANSIDNVVADEAVSGRTLDIVHLWDEVVGHYVWYAGLAILIAVCAASARGRALGVPVPAMLIGGAVTGITWATNGLEGGTAVFSLVCASVAIVWAFRSEGGLRVALAAGGLVATGILVVYGVVQGGFPQPSSL